MVFVEKIRVTGFCAIFFKTGAKKYWLKASIAYLSSINLYFTFIIFTTFWSD